MFDLRRTARCSRPASMCGLAARVVCFEVKPAAVRRLDAAVRISIGMFEGAAARRLGR